MKKIIKKICMICICLFCIMCQTLNNNIYAYSIEEVKKEANFKTVEEDGEPEDYDILIDAEDLITNEKLPAGIKTTIEDILYDNSGLLGIDFFGENKTKAKSNSKKKKTADKKDNKEEKEEEKFQTIKNFVRNAYRVFLYIACGAMIVVLIYMSIVTVVSGISPTINILPFSGLINGKKGEKPNQYLKAKKLVENWIKSVISLALAVFVMNLIVAFSNNIVNDMNEKKLESEKITVYVKNSKFAVDAPILGGSGSSSSTSTPISSTGSDDDFVTKFLSEAKSITDYVRTNGFTYGNAPKNPAINSDAHLVSCDRFVGWVLYNVGYTDQPEEGGLYVRSNDSSHDLSSFCESHGFQKITSLDECKAGDIMLQGSSVPTHTYILGYEKDNGWERYDCGMQSRIDSVQPSVEAKSNGFLYAYRPVASDGTSSNSTSSSGVETKTVDYYFDTNLEGLLMFQSQYNAAKSPLKAGINMISGFVVTIFKWFLYGLFVVRMLLVAGISTVAPILILMDAFIKIGGGKSFISNWIKLYLYLVLLRPIIVFIYYVMVQSNIYLISDVPFYIIFVIIGICILFVKSLKYLFRDLGGKKMKNKVK